jgi:bud site selection protein 20
MDRTHHMRRDQYRAHRTRARTKDLDQIQLDMDPKNRSKMEVQPIDESLPGLGQHVRISWTAHATRKLIISTVLNVLNTTRRMLLL